MQWISRVPNELCLNWLHWCGTLMMYELQSKFSDEILILKPYSKLSFFKSVCPRKVSRLFSSKNNEKGQFLQAVVWKAIYIIQRIAKMNAEMKQTRCIIQGTSLIPALNEILQTKSASGVDIWWLQNNSMKTSYIVNSLEVKQ